MTRLTTRINLPHRNRSRLHVVFVERPTCPECGSPSRSGCLCAACQDAEDRALCARYNAEYHAINDVDLLWES